MQIKFGCILVWQTNGIWCVRIQSEKCVVNARLKVKVGMFLFKGQLTSMPSSLIKCSVLFDSVPTSFFFISLLVLVFLF